MSKNLFKFAAPAALMSMMPAIAQAANLESDDFVGISFWLISMALVASTAFFFLKHSVWPASGKHLLSYQGWSHWLPLFTISICVTCG